MQHPELIYLYIEQAGQIKKQGITFSRNYQVEYNREQDRKLIITHKEDLLGEIYGRDITNISLLVGSNGSGKTTIMEMLALPKQVYMKRFGSKSYAEDVKWFAVYSVDTFSPEKTTFYFEGTDESLISNLSIESRKKKEKDVTFPFVCIYRNEKFIKTQRENFNPKLQLYYCPIVGPVDTMFKVNQDSPIKWVFRPAKAEAFFRFMACEYTRIRSDVYASNLTFRITLESEIYSDVAEDVASFHSKKDFFLLSLHNYAKVELDVKYGAECFAQVRDDYYDKIENEALRKLLKEYDDKQHDFRERGKVKGKRAQEIQGDLEYYAKQINSFEQLPEQYYVKRQEIKIPCKESELSVINTHIFDFVDKYEKWDYLKYEEETLEGAYIKCTYANISSGEEQMLRLFAGLYDTLRKTPKDPNVYSTKIILLDEPDMSMHPEWSRCFLADLVRMISGLNHSERVAYQIIIGTHSPFMLSDVLRDYIVCLERTQEGILFAPSNFGLLSNIHDIMMDTFFLKSPFGEMGTQIFESWTAYIAQLTEVNEVETERLHSCIDQIGDEVVRKHLRQQLIKKCNELSAETGDVDARIEWLEKELTRLKEGKSHDAH